MARRRSSGPSKPYRPKPALPYARSLEDFGALSPAEARLLDCWRQGKMALVQDDRPETATSQNSLRAHFVAFLALGGDESAHVHVRSVRLRGGWLIGALDVASGSVDGELELHCCRIERVDVRFSKVQSFSLRGCRLDDALYGDGLQCHGHFELNHGFHSTAEVRLLDAMINGDLRCTDARFESSHGAAFTLDRASIAGSVQLRGSDATGEVRLVGARIGANLDCGAAGFANLGGFALSGDRAEIGGSVYLRNGFTAQGGVRLIGAAIDGDLDCGLGRFESPQAYALLCDDARVAGAANFNCMDWVNGLISLASMHAGTLIDDSESWSKGDGNIVLNGFVYKAIAHGPLDAASRIAWLDRQPPEHLGKQFKVQPWEHLIRVLRHMGHLAEARTVAIAKQDRLRRSGRIAGLERILHWLYGAVLGYGYRPSRLLGAITLVWLLCASAYWAAANPRLFGATTHLIAPAGHEPSAECLLARAAAKRGDPCPLAATDYRTFVPLVYSADVLLPVLDLGYRDEWRLVAAGRDGKPLLLGQVLQFIYWFEIVIGWLAGLQLVGMFSNLIKNEWRPDDTSPAPAPPGN